MSEHVSNTIRIRHIVDAINKIQSYVSGISETEFYEDEKTIQAVERNFEIIGEAAKRVPDDIQNKYTGVEWLDMRDMRNFIIHQYDDVEEHVLWNTIKTDLPPLLKKLEQILGELE